MVRNDTLPTFNPRTCKSVGVRQLIYDKIIAVVGESAGGHGFPRPNPVSIRREYIRSRLDIGWCMKTLQKMKLLGAEC